MSASQKVDPLLTRHAELIAAHDAITGNDQSSIARRAGKVRQINVVELNMTFAGVQFDHFVSPASVKTRQGSPTRPAVDLVCEMENLRELIADDKVIAAIRKTADDRLRDRLKSAVKRELATTNAGGQFGGYTDAGQELVSTLVRDDDETPGRRYSVPSE